MAITAGVTVGVGFLSGKEAQLFWGSGVNVVLFGVSFALCTLVVREFCRASHAQTVGKTCAQLLGKGATALQTAIAFCSFVCVVTVLAGANECICTLFGIDLPLPAFAFVTAIGAALLCKAKVAVVKVANVISLLLAAILLIFLYAKGTAGKFAPPPLWQPALYALFSVTMSLGASAKLSQNCTAKENVCVSVFAAALICALMAAILPLCNFDASLPTLYDLNLPVKIFAAIALLLSSVTGLTANVLPIAELLKSVLPDETLCLVLIFGFALALSMFGFDFAVRVGYVVVALVGLFVVATATKKLATRKRLRVKGKSITF